MSTRSTIDWNSVRVPGSQRQFPVYLLIDTSSSMKGAAINAVHRGLELLQREVASKAMIKSVLKLGVISFGSDARLAHERLVPFSEFTIPALIASGFTRLDLAFEQLISSMDRDVVKATQGGARGDWKPVVFVLTDGRPTDECGATTDRLWRPLYESLQERSSAYMSPQAIITFGCGPDVDDKTLKEIATADREGRPFAFRMESSEASFVKFFLLVTQSIARTFQADQGAGHFTEALEQELENVQIQKPKSTQPFLDDTDDPDYDLSDLIRIP